MSAYYSDEFVTLYHGDCRDVLPSMEPDSVDLIVTDPPYGMAWRSARRTTTLDLIAGDDETAPTVIHEALTLGVKLLKDNRHLYVFGSPDLSGLPLGSSCQLAWDKEHVGMGDLTLPWGPSWEPITFAVYVSRPSGRARGDGRLAARLRRGSVLRVPRHNAGQLETRKDPHPTGKPVALIRQLVESSSMFGEIVLDPFAGAGSTLLAAVAEGRRAIGVELDEAHCERAARRLSSLTRSGAVLPGGEQT